VNFSPRQLPTLADIDLKLAEKSLYEYIKQAWHVLEPGTEYLDNWHIPLISEHLEAVLSGDILRLVINIPPRYMKSLITSVMWPTWAWIIKPEMRWLFASYSSSLSIMHSVLRRHLIQSPWYQSRWKARYKLLWDQNQKTEFANSKLGMMIATSVGGTATGKGGNILVLDDPLNPMEALSDTQRESTNQWIRQTFTTRLNDKKKGAIVVIMQRLHEQDPTGMLLEQGYTHLKIQAEPTQRVVYSFPISGKELVREAGSMLWEEREGKAELAAQQVALGSYAYAGQYQQEPAPLGGGILKRFWWRFWYPTKSPPPAPVMLRLENGEMFTCPQVALPERFDQALQSWDLAFKGTAGSSRVCGGVLARRGPNIYLLDLVADLMTFIGSIDAILKMSQKWPKVYQKLIEDKANGPAAIEMLRKRIAGIKEIEPHGDKVTRCAAVSPVVESGNVYLPHPSLMTWVDGFITEAAKFPNGSYKDQVDMLTQALLILAQTNLPKSDAKAQKPDEAPAVDKLLKEMGWGKEATNS